MAPQVTAVLMSGFLAIVRSGQALHECGHVAVEEQDLARFLLQQAQQGHSLTITDTDELDAQCGCARMRNQAIEEYVVLIGNDAQATGA